MKNLIFVLALSFALPSFAKTLTIGIDISGSNPVVSSPEFAKVAAQHVKRKVSALQLGDVVEIRPIGDRSMANFKVERIQINRRNRADKVSDMVARYVGSLPTRNFAGGSASNILSFLEFGQFKCADKSAIFLLTDGIENSQYISGQDFILGKPFPAPETNYLAGCEVTMLGIGQNVGGEIPPLILRNMLTTWKTYMQTAGATFTPVVNP